MKIPPTDQHVVSVFFANYILYIYVLYTAMQRGKTGIRLNWHVWFGAKKEGQPWLCQAMPV